MVGGLRVLRSTVGPSGSERPDPFARRQQHQDAPETPSPMHDALADMAAATPVAVSPHALPQLKCSPAVGTPSRAAGWKRAPTRSVFDTPTPPPQHTPAPHRQRPGSATRRMPPVAAPLPCSTPSPAASAGIAAATPTPLRGPTPTQRAVILCGEAIPQQTQALAAGSPGSSPVICRLSSLNFNSLLATPTQQESTAGAGAPAALSPALDTEVSKKKLPPLAHTPEQAKMDVDDAGGVGVFSPSLDAVTLRDLEVWVHARQVIDVEREEVARRALITSDEADLGSLLRRDAARYVVHATEAAGRRDIETAAERARFTVFTAACRGVMMVFIHAKCTAGLMVKYYYLWQRAVGMERGPDGAPPKLPKRMGTAMRRMQLNPDAVAGLEKQQRAARADVLISYRTAYEDIQSEAAASAWRVHAHGAVTSAEEVGRKAVNTAQLETRWALRDRLDARSRVIVRSLLLGVARERGLMLRYYRVWWRISVGLPNLLRHVDAWLLANRYASLARFRVRQKALQKRVRIERGLVMESTALAMLCARYWRSLTKFLSRRKAGAVVQQMACENLIRLAGRYYTNFSRHARARRGVRVAEGTARTEAAYDEKMERSAIRKEFWAGMTQETKMCVLRRMLREPLFVQWVQCMRLYVVRRKLMRYHCAFRWRAWRKYAREHAGVRWMAVASRRLWLQRVQAVHVAGWQTWARRQARLRRALADTSRRSMDVMRRARFRTLRAFASTVRQQREHEEIERRRLELRQQRLTELVPELECIAAAASQSLLSSYYFRLRLAGVHAGITRGVADMARRAQVVLIRRYLALWTEWCSMRFRDTSSSNSITSSQMSLP